jgi:hypothetical protein
LPPYHHDNLANTIDIHHHHSLSHNNLHGLFRGLYELAGGKMELRIEAYVGKKGEKKRKTIATFRGTITFTETNAIIHITDQAVTDKIERCFR